MTNTYMRSTVFWDVTPYSLVEIYHCLRGTYKLYLLKLKKKKKNETPWLWSASELYRARDRRLLAK
jgi:hypothetical protein